MDEQWIEHLAVEYSPALLKYLMQHTSSREDAEDLLQEVLLSCHKHASEFDPERCNEQAWLYIIAKRKLVSYYRARKDQVSLDAMEPNLVPGQDDMEKAIHVMSCRQAVAKALSQLDEKSRNVIIFRFLKELSPEETARRMSLSAGNVRVIQSRALDKLTKILESMDFDKNNIYL